MTQPPDKPDWIDEAAEEIMLMTDRVAVPSAGFTTREYCDKASDIIREHFLKAARCQRCDGTGRFAYGGICLSCRGTKFFVPPTKGIDR